MTTQYTPILKLALPVQGELSGTWGDVVNDNITSMIEQAIAGRLVINTWSGNSHTLTTANGTTAEARAAMLSLTDSNTQLNAAGTVVCPALSKTYIVKNGAGQIITVKTASGSGIAIPNGKTMLVYCDGTNVLEGVDHVVTLSAGTLTITGLTTFASLKGADATTVTGILDEDNMASNSATKLVTQQSVKAYVDSQVGTVDTLAEILANGNTTGGTDIVASTDDKVQFRDAAIYINSGADGHLDVVADTEVQIVTSTLNVDAAVDLSSTLVLAGNADFNGDLDVDGTTNLDVVDIDGAVNMATTLLVTGNVDFNGDLDVDGTTNLDVVDIDGAVDMASTLTVGGTTNDGTTLTQITQSGTGRGFSVNRNVASATRAMVNLAQLHASGGAEAVLDIQQTTPASRAIKVTPDGSIDRFSVYGTGALVTTPAAGGHAVFNEGSVDADFRVESNASTHMLFVDGGNNRLGINTSSPSFDVDIQGANPQVNIEATTDNWSALRITSGATQANYMFFFDDTAERARISVLNSEDMTFSTASTPVERLSLSATEAVFNDTGVDTNFRVESNGNANMLFVDGGNNRVGIGTAAPDTLLHLSGADTAVIRLENTDTSLGPNQLIGALEFEKQDGSGAGAGVFGGIRMRVEDSVGANAYMTFSTGWSSGMDTERVRIQSSGGFITNPIAGGHAVFNDGGIDADFRVESEDSASMFKVDGALNQVQITGDSANSDSALLVRNNYNTVFKVIQDDTSISSATYAFMIDSSAHVSNMTTAGAMRVETYYGDSFHVNGLGTTVINEAGAATGDFRVESDSNANMLFVDGGANKVGIGTNSLGRVFNVYDPATDGAIKLETGGNSASIWSGIEFKTPTSQGFIYVPSNDSAGTIKFLPASSEVLALSNSAVVINEQSNDVDFRVESDSQSHMLFVDGGNNSVSIGTSTNSGFTLNVTGSTQVQNNLVVVSTGGANLTQGDIMIKSSTSDSPSARGQGVFMFNEGVDQTWYAGTGYNAAAHYHIGFAASASATKEGARVTNGVFSLYNSASGAVFNENSADRDFRVESDTISDALSVDGADGHTTIGSGRFSIGAGQARSEFISEVSAPSGTNITSIVSVSNANAMSSAAAATCTVYGSDNAGRAFMDVVQYKANAGVVVVSSSTLDGSPHSRTYIVAGYVLRVTMGSGASGYRINTSAQVLQYPH